MIDHPPIYAVIFDMDGVIIHSEPDHKKVEKQLFEKYNIPISDSIHHSYTGTGTKDMYTDLVKRFKLDLDPFFLTEMSDKAYLEYIQKEIVNKEAMPGLIDLLDYLKNKNLKLAVASSSPMKVIELVTEGFGIKKYFEVFVSGAELEKSKPDPTIFLQAAKDLEIPTVNCAVIEDSVNGVKAANAAGMFSIGYKPTENPQRVETVADVIVHSLSEIKTII